LLLPLAMSSESLSSSARTMTPWRAEADEPLREGTVEDSTCLLHHGSDSDSLARTATSARFHGRRVLHRVCHAAKISTMVLVVMAVAVIPVTLFSKLKVGLSQTMGLVATDPSDELEGRYLPHIQLVNYEAGLCLDWGNVIVTVKDCDHVNPTQLWTYDRRDHRLASVAGRCLDSGGKYVHTWDCATPTPSHQQWVYRKSTKQLIRFVNTDAFCMATDGAQVKMPPCSKNPDPEQEWQLEAETTWKLSRRKATTLIPFLSQACWRVNSLSSFMSSIMKAFALSLAKMSTWMPATSLTGDSSGRMT